MPLTRGITGFGEAPSAVSIKQFTGACHDASRLSGSLVTGIVPAAQTPSFHSATFSFGAGEAVRVLCSASCPVIAFVSVEAPNSSQPLNFIDCPRLDHHFAGFQVLTSSESSTPIDQVDLSSLGKDEIKQLEYWRPARLGDLIFNFWD